MRLRLLNLGLSVLVFSIKQKVAAELILEFLDGAKICMTKKHIHKSLMLSFNMTSKCLTELRKTRKVNFFRSNRKCYWGALYDVD